MTRSAATPSAHAEFEGPLFAAWGRRMREPALQAMLEHAAQRIGLPQIGDRAAWAAVDEATITAFAREAGAEKGTPWPNALATDFARYVRDGNRTEYEHRVAARQHRLTRAVVLAAHTDETGWLDEAADGIVVLCEQSTWSWAAHDDAHERRGFVIADAAAPYLDLGAGEVVAQLAVADHVLASRLDQRWPGLRERIRHEATLRVFDPFLNRDDLWWLGYWRAVNNWNPWIIGNVITAAILLIDDVALCARILARALESLDRFAATLPDDGAIDEGYSYWWNGACRLLECLDVVFRATDGALDATGIPVVRETLRFPYRMQLGAHWYVNVADASARAGGDEPWQVPFRWGRLIGDEVVVAHARGGRRPGGALTTPAAGLSRVVRALTDSRWRETVPAPPPLPAQVRYESVQLFVARECAGDPRGLALAVKGGHNGENHNHRDVGSFIVALDGQPLIVDIGKPTYTAQTFGPDRYRNPVMRSEWHNTIAPYGLEQGDGASFAARLLGHNFDRDLNVVADADADANAGADADADADADAAPTVRLELAGAFPLSDGSSWVRQATLNRGRGERIATVVITDTWALPGTAALIGSGVSTGAVARPSTVHLVLAGEVRGDGAIVRVNGAGSAAALRISVRSGAPDAEVIPVLEEWHPDDDELTRVWGATLTRLTFTAPDARAGSLTTTIEVER